MTDKKTIKKGSKVKLHYTGTLEDGLVFDDSTNRDPLEVEVGRGQLIKGFDSRLVGMKEGEEKEFILQPEEAYGPRVEQLKQKVPLATVEGKFKPEIGMMLHLKGQDGKVIAAKIDNVSKEDITLDINHPLAGKVLKFKIKILTID